jgi:hypothetical protein
VPYRGFTGASSPRPVGAHQPDRRPSGITLATLLSAKLRRSCTTNIFTDAG